MRYFHLLLLFVLYLSIVNGGFFKVFYLFCILKIINIYFYIFFNVLLCSVLNVAISCNAIFSYLEQMFQLTCFIGVKFN